MHVLKHFIMIYISLHYLCMLMRTALLFWSIFVLKVKIDKLKRIKENNISEYQTRSYLIVFISKIIVVTFYVGHGEWYEIIWK